MTFSVRAPFGLDTIVSEIHPVRAEGVFYLSCCQIYCYYSLYSGVIRTTWYQVYGNNIM